MKFKLDTEPNTPYATLTMEEGINGKTYMLQWEDEDMYQASKKVQANEKELKTMLARLPEPTLLYQVRQPQLQELVQYKTEVENTIFQFASNTKPVDRGPSDYDIGTNQKGGKYRGASKAEVDEPPPERYHPKIGLVLEIDFALHLPGHFDNCRIVYGLYRNGESMDPPRSTEWKEMKIKGFERDRYGYCILNTKTLIKDVMAYSGTVIIFEIQVGIKNKKDGETKQNPAQYQTFTTEQPTLGYDLNRYSKEDEEDDGDFIFQDQDDAGDKYMPYAWTMSELFHGHGELLEGIWKLPIYKPPTNVEATPYDFPLGIVRWAEPDLYIRIAYPDDQTDLECSPYFSNLYVLPKMHRFSCPESYMDGEKTETDLYDPNAKVEGLKIVLHYIEGLIPSALVRVALTVQIGKWITKDENGRLCFWAGVGHKHFLLQKKQDELKAKFEAEEEKQKQIKEALNNDGSEEGSKKNKKKKKKKDK